MFPLLPRASTLALVVLVGSLAACGSAVFGSGGVGSFTGDEKPFFEGCSYDESKGVSTWSCVENADTRIVEYRAAGAGLEAAIASYTAAHPERGAIAKRKDTEITFVSGGNEIKGPAAMLQQSGKLTLLAAGPAEKATAPSRGTFYVACTVNTKEEVQGSSEMIDLGIHVVMCAKRVKAVLGVVDRYRP